MAFAISAIFRRDWVVTDRLIMDITVNVCSYICLYWCPPLANILLFSDGAGRGKREADRFMTRCSSSSVDRKLAVERNKRGPTLV